MPKLKPCPICKSSVAEYRRTDASPDWATAYSCSGDTPRDDNQKCPLTGIIFEDDEWMEITE